MSYIERITDERNVLGFGSRAVVEAELYCTVDPGFFGELPSIVLDAISILGVYGRDGERIELTDDQEDAAVKFVDEDTQSRWEEIESKALVTEEN